MGVWTDVRDEPETCDVCGGQAFRPATRRERFARWFSDGAGASTAWYCRSCGGSWSHGGGYLLLEHAPGARHPGRRALDVLDAVRHARTWHPVPRFYAAVGAIAVVPAVAIAAWTRVRWRVAVLGLPATAIGAAFAASLASARGRAWRDVIRHLDPERAWREQIEEDLTELRAQVEVLPLLAPDGWPGELTLCGASWSIPPRGPRVLEEVGVLADHGDPQLDPDRHAPGWRPPTPRVEIRSSAEGIDLDTLPLVRVVDPLPLLATYETRQRRMFDVAVP